MYIIILSVYFVFFAMGSVDSMNNLHTKLNFNPVKKNKFPERTF